MLDVMPKKFIKLSEINNWKNYSNGLIGQKFAKKYTEEILKKWVESMENPLINPWIHQLFENRLNGLNNFLEQLEDEIGEKNLFLFFNEIMNEGSESEYILKKIKSIYGEIRTFNELKKENPNQIKKISKIGDIECDNEIISIKTILDLDLNYQIIEEIIRGLLLIEENKVVRKFNYIKLMNGENIDDNFLFSVSDFLNSTLIDSLEYMSKQIHQDYIHIELFMNKYDKAGIRNSLFESKINKYANHEDIIIFELSEKLIGENNNRISKIKLRFVDDLNKQKNSFSVSYDTNTYFEGNEISELFLRNRISSIIRKFDESFTKVPEDKEFIGWINITIHPTHEDYVINNKEKIHSLLKSIVGDKEYEIRVSLNPQWGFDLKETTVMRFDYEVDPIS